jgi:hypothetical protein
MANQLNVASDEVKVVRNIATGPQLVRGGSIIAGRAVAPIAPQPYNAAEAVRAVRAGMQDYDARWMQCMQRANNDEGAAMEFAAEIYCPRLMAVAEHFPGISRILANCQQLNCPFNHETDARPNCSMRRCPGRTCRYRHAQAAEAQAPARVVNQGNFRGFTSKWDLDEDQQNWVKSRFKVATINFLADPKPHSHPLTALARQHFRDMLLQLPRNGPAVAFGDTRMIYTRVDPPIVTVGDPDDVSDVFDDLADKYDYLGLDSDVGDVVFGWAIHYAPIMRMTCDELASFIHRHLRGSPFYLAAYDLDDAFGRLYNGEVRYYATEHGYILEHTGFTCQIPDPEWMRKSVVSVEIRNVGPRSLRVQRVKTYGDSTLYKMSVIDRVPESPTMPPVFERLIADMNNYSEYKAQYFGSEAPRVFSRFEAIRSHGKYLSFFGGGERFYVPKTLIPQLTSLAFGKMKNTALRDVMIANARSMLNKTSFVDDGVINALPLAVDIAFDRASRKEVEACAGHMTVFQRIQSWFLPSWRMANIVRGIYDTNVPYQGLFGGYGAWLIAGGIFVVVLVVAQSAAMMTYTTQRTIARISAQQSFLTASIGFYRNVIAPVLPLLSNPIRSFVKEWIMLVYSTYFTVIGISRGLFTKAFLGGMFSQAMVTSFLEEWIKRHPSNPYGGWLIGGIEAAAYLFNSSTSWLNHLVFHVVSTYFPLPVMAVFHAYWNAIQMLGITAVAIAANSGTLTSSPVGELPPAFPAAWLSKTVEKGCTAWNTTWNASLGHLVACFHNPFNVSEIAQKFLEEHKPEDWTIGGINLSTILRAVGVKLGETEPAAVVETALQPQGVWNYLAHFVGGAPMNVVKSLSVVASSLSPLCSLARDFISSSLPTASTLAFSAGIVSTAMFAGYLLNKDNHFFDDALIDARGTFLPSIETDPPLLPVDPRARAGFDYIEPAKQPVATVVGGVFVGSVPINIAGGTTAEYTSIRNRVVFAKPAIDDEMMEYVTATVDGYEVFDFSREYASLTFGYEEWNNRFPLATRARHDAARLEMLGRDLERQDMAIKAFPKQELLFNSVDSTIPDKAKRNISARKDQFNVVVGPKVLRFAKAAALHWSPTRAYHDGSVAVCYAAGWNAEAISNFVCTDFSQIFAMSDFTYNSTYASYDLLAHDIRATHLKPVHSFDYANALEVDISNFDGHMQREHLNWERIVMRRAGIPQHILSALFQPTTRGATPHGVLYRVPYTRKSGDPNTSVGNSIISVAMALFAVKPLMAEHDEGLSDFSRKVKLLVLGDDILAVSNLPFSEWHVSLSYQCMGVNAKMKLLDPRFSTFCSSYFWPSADGIVIAPKPFRVMSKIGMTLTEVKDRRAHLVGVAKGLWQDCYHVPVLNRYLRWILRDAYPDVEAKSIVNEYRFHAGNIHRPNADTEAFFQELYGVSSESVLKDLEPYLERKIPEQIVSSKLFNHCAKRDL